MAVINTNTKALFSQNALKLSGNSMSKAMEQLSTGKRINTAGDDAAGLAISTRMTTQIRALNQAVRNAGDAISMIQTAEGATNEITNMMQRMRELAIQAINDTNSNEDRSYLDLEFQQLKQEIVRVAEMTEWNGFNVLDGTAGERVGEMPVYKATSVSLSGDTFINPSTLIVPEGDDAGEVQLVTFAQGSGDFNAGILKINLPDALEAEPISVSITAAEAYSANNAGGMAVILNKIATTLEGTSYFSGTSGRTVEVVGTTQLKLTFTADDGDLQSDSVVLPRNELTGIGFSSAPAALAAVAVTSLDESFDNNGEFLVAGRLNVSVVDASTVNATFTTLDGEEIELVAARDGGRVTFAVTSANPASLNALANNRRVFTEELTYTFRDIDANELDPSDVTAGVFTGDFRQFGATISVDGGIPALRSGDLRINGIDIGPSYPADDTLSPPANAAGSAIAKAAAINRKAADVGVTVGEIQTLTVVGIPKPGVITVGGVAVEITSKEDTGPKAAAKIAAALRASDTFGQDTGRIISHASGGSVITVEFPVSDRDAGKITIQPGSTRITAVVDVVQEYSTASQGTGVFAKVNQNVVSGRSMSASSVVEGSIWINGYASANITTVLNNTRETRQQVASAINAITHLTGVKAVDTGVDEKGITLIATDGRNIEVRFDTTANVNVFGERVGLRQGVQAATISLESKIPTPVVLSSSPTGDISRVGFSEGNFTRNESVFNTAPRPIVEAPTSELQAINIAQSAAADSTFGVTVNGTRVEVDVTTGDTAAEIRDALIAAINNNSTRVTAVAGRTESELLLEGDTPGVDFTFSVTDTAGISSVYALQASRTADVKALGQDDLVINGIEIRAARASDDTQSDTTSLSSDRASSAIAIAAAINDHSYETGVRALANPAIIKGVNEDVGELTTNTDTSLPTGNYNLYVNGVTVPVYMVEGEDPEPRREKVVDAINARFGQHGVSASNNGYGVTLESDGRNLSVWFNGSIEGLTAASFGLDQGGAVSQESRVTITTAGVTAGSTVSIKANGVEASYTVTAGDSASDIATGLQSALDTLVGQTGSAGFLSNLSVSTVSGTSFTVTSNVAGIPFEIGEAIITPATAGTSTNFSVAVSTVTENSYGNGEITAIRPQSDGSSMTDTEIEDLVANSRMARTVYGTVRLVSDAALLPKIPSPIGAPPSDQLDKLRATGEPFTIAVGDKGFRFDSNFMALGFQEGTFGGKSSEAMEPPKVGRLAFQVGASAQQLITIDLADFGKNGSITNEITGDVDLNVEDRTSRINTRLGAEQVLQMLDESMDKVNATRAQMGAVMNRLQYAMDNLSNVSMNQEASRSQIMDADYAKASTDLAKSQIMQQAATAVLAQANMSQQSVLQLLQG
ncbi:MAG: flagellin [Bordetella sp.]|jgi:flagellin